MEFRRVLFRSEFIVPPLVVEGDPEIGVAATAQEVAQGGLSITNDRAPGHSPQRDDLARASAADRNVQPRRRRGRGLFLRGGVCERPAPSRPSRGASTAWGRSFPGQLRRDGGSRSLAQTRSCRRRACPRYVGDWL